MKSCVKSISIFLIFVFLWQNQPRSTYATVENGYLPVRQAGLRPLAVGEVESRAARNVTSVNEGRPQAAMEEKRASADGAEPEMSDRKTAINILREIVQKQFKGKMPVYHIGALDIEAMRLLDVAFYGAFTWEGPTELVIPRYMQIEHPNITLLEIATRIWDLLPDSQKTTSEALAQIVIRADAILGDAFSGFGRRRDVQLARLDTELIESERILLGFNIHELDDNGFAALNRDIREAFRGIAEGQVIPDRWRRFRLTLRELTPLVWDMLPESQRNEPDSAIQIAARLENILRDLSGEVRDKLATKGIDTWDVFDLDQKGGGLPETGPKGVGQADKGIVRHRGRLAVNDDVAIGLRESLTYLLARDKENNITEGEAQEFRDWFDHLRKPGEDIPPEKMFDKERLADIIAENKKGQILYVVYLPVQNFGYTKNNEPIYAHVNLREGIIWVALGRSRGKDNMDVTLARMHETEEYNIATDAGVVTEILREALGNDSRSVGLLASHLLTAYGNAVNIEEIAKWRDEGSPEAQLFFHFLHREVSAKVLDICGRAADDAPDPGTKAKFDEMKKRAEGLYKLALEIPEPEEPFFTGGIGQTAAGRPRQGGDTGRDKRASASGAAAKRQPAPIPKEALIAI